MHDTTVNHGQHIFDVNCKICSGEIVEDKYSSRAATEESYPGAPADSQQQEIFGDIYVSTQHTIGNFNVIARSV